MVITVSAVVLVPLALYALTEAEHAAHLLSGTQYQVAHVETLWLLVGAGLAVLYLIPAVQRGVARVTRLRPGSPLAYTSTAFFLLFAASQLGTELSADVLSLVAASSPLSNSSVLAQDIPLFLLAWVGVGVPVRRSVQDGADRLGFHRPRARWFLIALLGIGVFLLVASGIDGIATLLTPALQKRVTEVSNLLFRRFNNPPEIIFLGIVAAIAEETLFRGALQPRFGIVATSVLFALVHTQYGFTFASLEVFVLGLGLGWLRTQAGLWPCIVLHAGYDILVGLLGLLHP
jgi:membrane protease YdiL (CAAX protease family)